MSKYKESFQLNTTDIDLIERALRREISALAGLVHMDGEDASAEYTGIPIAG